MIDSDKNTWIGGMDQDTSKSKFQPNKYYELRNGHVVTHKGLSTGSIENEEGTSLLLTLPTIPSSVTLGLVNNVFPEQSNIKIIGWTTHRDDLIVCSTDSDGSSDSTGHIWLIPFNITTGEPTESIDITKHLKYVGDIDFNINYRIRKIIPRFEFGNNTDGGFYKVYWTNGHNIVKQINLFDKANYASGTTIVDVAPKTLGLVPFIGNWVAPSLVKIVSGGQLKSGVIQYAYQMYSKFNSETHFSPASNLIHLTSYSEYDSSSANYFGSVKGTSTGKAVEIKLPAMPTDLFDYVRLVSVYYDEYTSTPIITTIYDSKALDTEVVITDYGDTNLGNYTLAEYTTLGGTPFIANDLEVKNNRLIAGGIKIQSNFDINWDSRAYRFRNYNETIEAKLYQNLSNNTDLVTISGNNPDWSVPSDHNCINQFNVIEHQRDLETQYEYMYQADGITYGGEGPNIKYEFILKDLIIDDGGEDNNFFETIRKLGVTTEGTTENPSYTNYASPNIQYHYTGYMRDEIYSFGIVWINEYGKESFANWIGDIRFPRIYDQINTYSPVTRWKIETNNYVYNEKMAINAVILNPLGSYVFDSTVYYDNTEASVINMYDEIVYYVNVGSANLGITASYDTVGTMYLEAPFDFEISSLTGCNYYLTKEVTYGDVLTSGNFSTCTDHTAHILGIKFTIKNFPVGVTGYKIVRCERTSSDRTIEMQGLANITYQNDQENQDYYGYQDIVSIDEISGLSSNIRGNIITVSSPEASFFKDNFVKFSGDFLTFPALYKAGTDAYYKATLTTPNSSGRVAAQKFTDVSLYTSIANKPIKENTKLVFDAKVFPEQEKYTPATSIGGLSYHNYIITPQRITNKGSALLVNFVDQIYIDDVTKGCYLINYKRNIIPYKGNSYVARTQRSYIPCTDNISANISSIEVYGGDTFISYFAYMYSMEDSDPNHQEGEVNAGETWVAFPVETRINLDIRNDKLTKWFAQSNNVYGSATQWYLHETRALGLKWYPDTYPVGVDDLYTYNSAYSRPNNIRKSFPKPVNYEEITEFGTRIWASEKRISGSIIDQWTKFLPNTFKDVDTLFGNINALKIFRDQLVFFQDSGFGVQPIDERITTPDESGSIMVLGEGDILGRYGYISRLTGCSHQASVVTTEEQLHFFDIRLKRWNVYTGEGARPLSDVEGMHSHFTTYIDQYYSYMRNDNLVKTLPYGIHGTFDIKNNRILMTFLGGGYNETLSYNLSQNAFGEFLDYTPSLYVTLGNNLFAITNNGSYRNIIYKHGTGNYGTYYENAVPYDTVIKFISNKYPDNVKIYNALEYNGVVELNNTEYFDSLNNPETLSIFRILNDYQTSGFKELTIYGTPGSGSDNPDKLDVRRRGRIWRFYIPRSLKTSTDDREDARIRSQYCFLEFRYKNNNNKRLVLHDVTTHFTAV